ncbi:unnamed protein product [Amoebophrya sp. A120]|nr:unnamed protein product [Amoebophrya sp. A120]|eukprot:GSA120T00023338001.1
MSSSLYWERTMCVYDHIQPILTSDNRVNLDKALDQFAASNDHMLVKEAALALGHGSGHKTYVDIDTFLACLQKRVSAYGGRWGEAATSKLFCGLDEQTEHQAATGAGGSNSNSNGTSASGATSSKPDTGVGVVETGAEKNQRNTTFPNPSNNQNSNRRNIQPYPLGSSPRRRGINLRNVQNAQQTRVTTSSNGLYSASPTPRDDELFYGHARSSWQNGGGLELTYSWNKNVKNNYNNSGQDHFVLGHQNQKPTQTGATPSSSSTAGTRSRGHQHGNVNKNYTTHGANKSNLRKNQAIFATTTPSDAKRTQDVEPQQVGRSRSGTTGTTSGNKSNFNPPPPQLNGSKKSTRSSSMGRRGNSKLSTDEPIDYTTTDLEVSSVPEVEQPEIMRPHTTSTTTTSRPPNAGVPIVLTNPGPARSSTATVLTTTTPGLHGPQGGTVSSSTQEGVVGHNNTTLFPAPAPSNEKYAVSARARYISEFCEVMLNNNSIPTGSPGATFSPFQPFPVVLGAASGARQEDDAEYQSPGRSLQLLTKAQKNKAGTTVSKNSSKASKVSSLSGSGSSKLSADALSASQPANFTTGGRQHRQNTRQGRKTVEHYQTAVNGGESNVKNDDYPGRGTSSLSSAQAKSIPAQSKPATIASGSNNTSRNLFSKNRISTASSSAQHPQGNNRTRPQTAGGQAGQHPQRGSRPQQLPHPNTLHGQHQYYPQRQRPRAGAPTRPASPPADEFAESFFSDYHELREVALERRKREHEIVSSKFSHLHSGQPRRSRSTEQGRSGKRMVNQKGRPDLYYGIFPSPSPESKRRDRARHNDAAGAPGRFYPPAPPGQQFVPAPRTTGGAVDPYHARTPDQRAVPPEIAHDPQLLEEFYEFLSQKNQNNPKQQAVRVKTPSYRIDTPPQDWYYGYDERHDLSPTSRGENENHLHGYYDEAHEASGEQMDKLFCSSVGAANKGTSSSQKPASSQIQTQVPLSPRGRSRGAYGQAQVNKNHRAAASGQLHQKFFFQGDKDDYEYPVRRRSASGEDKKVEASPDTEEDSERLGYSFVPGGARRPLSKRPLEPSPEVLQGSPEVKVMMAAATTRNGNPTPPQTKNIMKSLHAVTEESGHQQQNESCDQPSFIPGHLAGGSGPPASHCANAGAGEILEAEFQMSGQQLQVGGGRNNIKVSGEQLLYQKYSPEDAVEDVVAQAEQLLDSSQIELNHKPVEHQPERTEEINAGSTSSANPLLDDSDVIFPTISGVPFVAEHQPSSYEVRDTLPPFAFGYHERVESTERTGTGAGSSSADHNGVGAGTADEGNYVNNDYQAQKGRSSTPHSGPSSSSSRKNGENINGTTYQGRAEGGQIKDSSPTQLPAQQQSPQGLLLGQRNRNYLSGLSLQKGNMNSDTNILSILPSKQSAKSSGTRTPAGSPQAPNSCFVNNKPPSSTTATVQRQFTHARMVALSKENADSVEIVPPPAPTGVLRGRPRSKTASSFGADSKGTTDGSPERQGRDPGEASGLALQYSTELNFRNLLRGGVEQNPDNSGFLSARSRPRPSRQLSPPMFSSPRPDRETRRRQKYKHKFSRSLGWQEALRTADPEFRKPFRTDMNPSSRWTEFGSSQMLSRSVQDRSQ